MKSLPPHLPKKEKVVAKPQSQHSLFYFLSCAFIAIAASLSTVFVALSWIIPHAVPEVQFYNFPHENTAIAPTPDAELLTRVAEREAVLYDKRTVLAGGWYAEGSELSHGVFLTSDGWAVFPLASSSQLDKTNTAFFQVVDSRGVPFTLDQVVVDKTFHLAYAKVNGVGFHFVSFPSWDGFKENARVLGKKGNSYDFDTLSKLQKNLELEASSEIWKPEFVLHLAKAELGMVFSDQGELLGVQQQNAVLPAWYIEQSLVSLLSKHTLSYTAFPWKGETVDRNLQNGFIKNINGFFVTDLGGDKTKNGIKVGDVITKIQGQNINPLNRLPVLFAAPDTVTFEILRDGKTLQEILPKQIISF